MIPLLHAGAIRLVDAIPFIPDGDEAREWAKDELSDPIYQASKPTLIDRISGAIADFLSRLFNPDLGDGWSPVLTGIIVAVIILVIVLAFLVWGRPRLSHTAEPRGALLFGDDDERTAAELRASSQAAAAAGDWERAIIDGFRALARSLAERDVVDTPPGMTSQQLAREATRPFPDKAAALAQCSAVFDDVRYVRRPATAQGYQLISATDAELQATRPLRAPRPVEMAQA
ncbi:MAG: DUF4129 domain-containing protein [Microbacterium sp.]